jgi:hypothetical protein
MPDYRFWLCGLLSLFLAGVVVRDLAAGTSGVSGALIPLRCTRDDNPLGYTGLVFMKLAIAGYMGLMALHFAGWGPDPLTLLASVRVRI